MARRDDASPRVIEYVRWWIISICVALIGAGVAFVFVHLDDGPKYFVSGALVGAGLAGALAELFSAPDRRESDRRLDELRGTTVANYRLAYNMGEFVWGFYAHLSKGETTHHEVNEILELGESLGIRDSLQALVAQASSTKIDLDDVKDRVEHGLRFKGQHLEAFFDIGFCLLTLRSDGAKKHSASRGKVGADLAGELEDVSGVIVGVSPLRAWRNVRQLWDENKLTDQQIDKLLLALHAFFKFLEDNQKAYQLFKRMVSIMSEEKFVKHPEQEVQRIIDGLAQLNL